MPNKYISNKLKSWWQQRFKKDALDWRSLSPNRPPLPILSSETLDSISHNDSTPVQNHSSIIIESISNNSKASSLLYFFFIFLLTKTVLTHVAPLEETILFIISHSRRKRDIDHRGFIFQC